VLTAGDDVDAKAALAAVIEAGGLRAVDAGALKLTNLKPSASFS
jgi:hypothetical protein